MKRRHPLKVLQSKIGSLFTLTSSKIFYYSSVNWEPLGRAPILLLGFSTDGDPSSRERSIEAIAETQNVSMVLRGIDLHEQVVLLKTMIDGKIVNINALFSEIRFLNARCKNPT